MWFKNIIPFTFNKDFNVTSEQLEKALSEFKFAPCGSQDISRLGFSNALGKLGKSLVHSVGQSHLICVTKEEKLLPAEVIRDAVSDKVEAIEYNESRKITQKRKRLDQG